MAILGSIATTRPPYDSRTRLASPSRFVAPARCQVPGSFCISAARPATAQPGGRGLGPCDCVNMRLFTTMATGVGLIATPLLTQHHHHPPARLDEQRPRLPFPFRAPT